MEKDNIGQHMIFLNEILVALYGSMFGFIRSKIACSVGEYLQQSIKADSILEQRFLDREC